MQSSTANGPGPAGASVSGSGPPSQFETILVERGDGVLHLTLNRPHKKNAVNSTMWSELAAVLAQVAGDNAIRALVLRGAGGAFCSGADLGGDPAGPDDGPAGSAYVHMKRIHAVAEALFRVTVPTVASVDGDAVGAGCNLALACDVVLASSRSRFSQIFVRRGLSPDCGGSWLVPRLVGLQRAKLLCLTGDIIDARAAAEMGLIAGVYEPDQLEEEVERLVAKLRQGPPLALALTKRLLNDAATATLTEALDAEATAQAVNLAAADSVEARQAFLEKREPRFTGR